MTNPPLTHQAQSSNNPSQSIANTLIQCHTDHIPITQCPLHTSISPNHQNWIVTHWHRSCQSYAYRRTKAASNLGTRLLLGPNAGLVGGRFCVRDTATPVPIEHHSSHCITNSMSIRCQSNANPMSMHSQSCANLVPIFFQF